MALILADDEDEFDEYTAEMNENAIVVRVAKNSRMVTRVYEKNDICFSNDEIGTRRGKDAKKMTLQCADDGDNVLYLL